MEPAPPTAAPRAKLGAVASALAALAVAFALAALLCFASAARVRRDVVRIAPLMVAAKTQGTLLAREAIARRDLLVVYGSSELVRPSANRAGEFFASLPTGFAAFPIGNRGVPPLVTLERIAPLGDRLRGRKIVVVVTPPTFLAAPGPQDSAGYLGNASRLQTYETLFGTELDRDWQRRIARRLREIPQIAADDSFLASALAVLASDGEIARTAEPVVRWLGRLEAATLALADEAAILRLRVGEAPSGAAHAPIDYPELLRRAEADYGESVRGHAFGFVPPQWASPAHLARMRGITSNARFLSRLAASPRWGDLDLLLELIEREGGDALLISLPFAGAHADHTGISRSARGVYYARIRELASRHRVRCRTLESLEYEPLFFQDPFGHPSPKGWLFLDSMLDEYVHDTLD